MAREVDSWLLSEQQLHFTEVIGHYNTVRIMNAEQEAYLGVTLDQGPYLLARLTRKCQQLCKQV